MSELFNKIKSGDVKGLIAEIESAPEKVNEVSKEGLSVFEALLNSGYTKAAEHLVTLPEFDINHEGHNPLRIAVAMGCIDLASTLLEMGASPNYRPEVIVSALLLCLENEYFDLAELMVEKGAEVDIRNEQGWTPLIWASMKGRQKAVDFLIAHDVNIHACNNDGWNAVTGAYFKKRNVIVKQLLDQGAVFGAKYAEAALLSAYENGYLDVVNYLLDEFNTNPNVADTKNVSLLAKAVSKGDWELVKKLLEKDADPNVFDSSGVPVLALLASNGHIELMKLFLAKNAHIHLASATGETAIHYAANNNQLESIKFLIGQGADVNAQTKVGETPMMMAARKGYVAVVKLLLKSGANRALITEDKSTAISIAKRNAPRNQYHIMTESAFSDIVKMLALPGHE